MDHDSIAVDRAACGGGFDADLCFLNTEFRACDGGNSSFAHDGIAVFIHAGLNFAGIMVGHFAEHIIAVRRFDHNRVISGIDKFRFLAVCIQIFHYPVCSHITGGKTADLDREGDIRALIFAGVTGVVAVFTGILRLNGRRNCFCRNVCGDFIGSREDIVSGIQTGDLCVNVGDFHIVCRVLAGKFPGDGIDIEFEYLGIYLNILLQ